MKHPKWKDLRVEWCAARRTFQQRGNGPHLFVPREMFDRQIDDDDPLSFSLSFALFLVSWTRSHLYVAAPPTLPRLIHYSAWLTANDFRYIRFSRGCTIACRLSLTRDATPAAHSMVQRECLIRSTLASWKTRSLARMNNAGRWSCLLGEHALFRHNN